MQQVFIYLLLLLIESFDILKKKKKVEGIN